jgi:hypothetical protein
MFGSFFLLAALALQGSAPHPSIQVVPPDPAAAQKVQIVGATDAEAAIAHAALARLGRHGPVTRIELGHQQRGKSIAVVYRSGRRDRFRSSWLAQLAADDIGASLSEQGEDVTWVELRGPDGGGTGFEALTTAQHSQKGLRKLAHRIAGRAHAQHQPVTSIVAYEVAHGAFQVVIRLSREQYLQGTNTRWLDLVPDRFDADTGYSAYVLVLGPGGVHAAEGANFGPNGGAFAFGPTKSGDAAPLAGQFSLRVTVHRSFPQERRFSFTVDCATETSTCTGFRRDWTLLVAPTVEGSECSPPAGLDTITISGSVAGIPVQREYDGCYSGVVEAWDKLLGVPTRR